MVVDAAKRCAVDWALPCSVWYRAGSYKLLGTWFLRNISWYVTWLLVFGSLLTVHNSNCLSAFLMQQLASTVDSYSHCVLISQRVVNSVCCFKC